MKLPKAVVTKKDKKIKNRKKFAVIFVFAVLFISLPLLIFLAFFDKEPIYISPLAKNQTSQVKEIESLLKNKKITYHDISTKDLSFVIRLEGESTAIIDPSKDIEQQLSSLQLIITQLTIEGKTFKAVDFRFEKPIIKF